MTIAARKVLEDCQGAIGEIVDGIQVGAWRRRWVAAIVLLRSVCYVLSAVDSKRNDAYKRAIDNAWKKLNESKPEPTIFWEFIDNERHNTVHEYEVRAGQGVTVHLGQNKPHDYHYIINAGPFKGHDHREVLSKAVKWW